MTCIVGVVENGKVYIGGDSAGVGGLDITIRKDKKVFRTGSDNEFIMGFTSSFRMGQLLNYSLTVPRKPETQDTMAFMVSTFIESVRTCLKCGGFTKVVSNNEEGGAFLVGYNGRLFIVAEDFQVGESYDDYMATGCGENIALGSLYATKGRHPEERVKLALAAAAHHSAGVSEPFFVETI